MRCTHAVPVADHHLLGITVGGPSLVVLRCADRGQPIDTRSPIRWLGTSQVSDALPAGDHGAAPTLGTVALVGSGRAVPVGGGGTVAGELTSPPDDPGRTPTTGTRSPPGAGQSESLAECQREGVGAHPWPL